MILEVKGNLITMCERGLVEIMVHGCNCFHAMGSGIAGQLARKHPEVPKADRVGTVCGDLSKIGSYTIAEVSPKAFNDVPFVVFNAYTQNAPSYDGSDVFAYESFPDLLETIRSSLGDVMQYTIMEQPDAKPLTIGFPQIGAGLAGGDWPRIRQMIVDAFEAEPHITVVLVEYQP